MEPRYTPGLDSPGNLGTYTERLTSFLRLNWWILAQQEFIRKNSWITGSGFFRQLLQTTARRVENGVLGLDTSQEKRMTYVFTLKHTLPLTLWFNALL
jgi:hypothetical protein